MPNKHMIIVGNAPRQTTSLSCKLVRNRGISEQFCNYYSTPAQAHQEGSNIQPAPLNTVVTCAKETMVRCSDVFHAENVHVTVSKQKKEQEKELNTAWPNAQEN